MQPKKVIIDCDPGMDDSLALILACKSKALDVKAITAVPGNYPIDVTSKNIRKTLELIGRTNIPVAQGLEKPLVRDLAPDPFSHGADGQANYNLPEPVMPLSSSHGVDLIIETVKKHENDIHLIALGPLSNVAMAFMKAPEIKGMLSSVTAIAGSFGLNRYSTENATGDNPQSEWNVYVDPEAAQIVFNSGVPLTAVGLDVATHFDVNFTEDDLYRLRSSQNKEADFLLNMINFVLGRGFQSYCVLIDSLAVARVIDPTLMETIVAKVGVETQGKLTLGMTIMDNRHHHGWTHLPDVEIAAKADYRRFLDLVMESVID